MSQAPRRRLAGASHAAVHQRRSVHASSHRGEVGGSGISQGGVECAGEVSSRWYGWRGLRKGELLRAWEEGVVGVCAEPRATQERRSGAPPTPSHAASAVQPVESQSGWSPRTADAQGGAEPLAVLAVCPQHRPEQHSQQHQHGGGSVFKNLPGERAGGIRFRSAFGSLEKFAGAGWETTPRNSARCVSTCYSPPVKSKDRAKRYYY